MNFFERTYALALMFLEPFLFINPVNVGDFFHARRRRFPRRSLRNDQLGDCCGAASHDYSTCRRILRADVMSDPVVLLTMPGYTSHDPLVRMIGNPFFDGMRAAAKAVNLNGGISGRPLHVVECEGRLHEEHDT